MPPAASTGPGEGCARGPHLIREHSTVWGGMWPCGTEVQCGAVLTDSRTRLRMSPSARAGLEILEHVVWSSALVLLSPAALGECGLRPEMPSALVDIPGKRGGCRQVCVSLAAQRGLPWGCEKPVALQHGVA